MVYPEGGVPKARRLRVHLPSGVRVWLDVSAAAREVNRRPRADRILDAVEVVGSTDVVVRDDGTEVDALDLATRDVHVLRAMLVHERVLTEERADFDCENCSEPFSLAPTLALEAAPFLDGELDDPRLDAPFDFAANHPIATIAVGRTRARTVRLAPRTARESRALYAACDQRTMRMTPAVVAAMGIVALGREPRASVIADAIARAPARALQSLIDVYFEAHYPARLVAVHRCPSCDARNDIDVPIHREFDRFNVEREPNFRLELDDFEQRVRAIAKSVYRDLAIANVDFVVDDDVARCDDGGEPLLGCYTPGGQDPDTGIEHPPEVRLFHRTFVQAARFELGFDVDAEIRETIEHELTHHLHYLRGDDPLDDAEHEALDRERLELVGRKETLRRMRRDGAQSLVGFVRTTWPAWLLVLLVTVLVAWAESR